MAKLHWTPLLGNHIDRAVVHERFHILVWPFGRSYQCKVVVTYLHTKDRHLEIGPGVGVGLPLSRTKKEAGQRGLEWVETYRKEGPPKAEVTILECLKYYPDLYQTRADVLEHLFYVLGNGYSWLDGALISNTQEPLQDPSERLTEYFVQKMEDLLDKVDAVTRERLLKEVRKDAPTPRPSEDSGASRDFYPVSDSSKIYLVPPDVQPDWLGVSIEAAELLRDRSTDPHQQEIGRALTEKLRPLAQKAL